MWFRKKETEEQRRKRILESEDSWSCYRYALEVIKDRWPEAEDIIIKDSDSALYYSAEVIKGRWPEAEDIIMKDPHNACQYAQNIIKDRWLEAEPYIMKNLFAARCYMDFVLIFKFIKDNNIQVKEVNND
jgi:hypothetical protein